MASWHATAAILCLFKLDWEFPTTESYLFGYQLRKRTAMNSVAYCATSAFFLPVYMNVMEISLSVSESGGIRGFRKKKKISLVT